MKTILLFFLMCAFAVAGQLSDRQLALIRGIEQLSAQQKDELNHAQADYLKVEGQRDWWQTDDAKQAARGDIWEHRTEVIVEIGALFFSLWIWPILAGQVLKNFPSLEGWVFSIILFALCLFSGMWVLNHFLDIIGKVIPTIPSWDQSVRWIHHARESLK